MRYMALALWRFVLLFPFFLSHLNADEFLTSPPPELPVKVKTGFYLLNFTSINEKDETFLTDVYFSFKWQDPRLANASKEPRIYMEEAAMEKLTTIWRPHLEFINAYEPIYNNRTLIIHPNGNVEYHISLTSHFFTRLNFKRFPFDTQVLRIQLDSFTWNNKILQFVPSSDPDFMYNAENINTLEEHVVEVRENVETIITGPIFDITDKTREFSRYVAEIVVERKSGYFIFQVFLPLFLIMAMSCTVFFGFECPFLDKIMINMTAFLVILATKFTINLNLPEVGYLTMVDKAFLAAYICIGLTIVVDALQQLWMDSHVQRAKHLNAGARWAIFLLFVTLIIMIFLTA